MGIDRYFAEFLGCAYKGGVDFSRTATLGRLNLFIDRRSLRAVLRQTCGGVTDDEVSAVHMGSDGYAEEFLKRLGAKEVTSIDASAYEGATLVHDMNLPIGDALKRRFSAVIDGGTLEHVFNFPMAIRNCMQMLDVGGHFFVHTMANNFMGHGFYQFSPELFYRVLSPENGFRMRRVVVFEQRIGRPLCSPDDLLRLNQAVLLYASAPPARLRLQRWDQVSHFRRLAEGGGRPAGTQRPASFARSALVRRVRGKGEAQ